jgi:CBS domain-containing protein
MRVLEMMMGTPYFCHPESNLGEATELMWKGNCGFLPVAKEDGKIIGVITDRDICIALGTRGRPPGEIPVVDAMTQKVYSCAPEDDVYLALAAMREGRVRRLPVISKEGILVGVVSMDDVLLHADAGNARSSGISSEEVVKTFRAINTHQVPMVAAKQAGA